MFSQLAALQTCKANYEAGECIQRGQMIPFRGRDAVLIIFAILLLLWVLPATAETTGSPASKNAGCGAIAGRLPHDVATFGRGIFSAPRNAVRPANLKWELPVAAGTGLLIAYADYPASRRIQSPSFESDSTLGSNIGIGLEFGGAGLMYLLGCHNERSAYLANTGWTALEAMGAANILNLGLKAAINRQYAYARNSRGEFWEGGKSFPSGHAATSFAFAAVIAHRYPQKRWVKWTAYGLATGVTMARIGGKKHFLSDTVVGATLGYVTGTYFAGHSEGP